MKTLDTTQDMTARAYWVNRAANHKRKTAQYSDSAREIFLTLDALMVQWRKHTDKDEPTARHAVQDALEAVRAARATLPTFNRGQR
jgi:hypothetical protein